MYIESVKLNNFRSYENKEVTFKEGLNIIVGKNAVGKTNLLESIYCCGIGKSPRTNKYKEMIKWGNDIAYIKVVLRKNKTSHTIEFSIDNQDKKRISIDGIPLVKLGDIIGLLNIVFFSPDEMKLIKESPQERRRFADISLSQQNKKYFYSLSKYNNILSQRNKLLKEHRDVKALPEMLYGWDVQLAEHGAYIIQKRYEFVDKIQVFAKKMHSELTDNLEELELEYESRVEYGEYSKMKEDFFQRLRGDFEKDLNLSYTSFGAHRDDIGIKINGIDARKFGSQGQQRSVALSLKLAEIYLFESEVGEKPVLLLDDVLSELDPSRRKKLMELSSGLQTLITCTDFDMDIAHNRIIIEKDERV
ncbi:MAG: DNA replication/repair protein RecF [Clostridia bacterium]|nr:DNA replication/repair protein RecF [Clostridia bacterium]